MEHLETILVFTEGVLVEPVLETWLRIAGMTEATPEMIETTESWNNNEIPDERFLDVARSFTTLPRKEIIPAIVNSITADDRVIAYLGSANKQYRVILCTELAHTIESGLKQRNILPFPEVVHRRDPLQGLEKAETLLVAWNPLKLYTWIDEGWNGIVYPDFDRLARELSLRRIHVSDT